MLSHSSARASSAMAGSSSRFASGVHPACHCSKAARYGFAVPLILFFPFFPLPALPAPRGGAAAPPPDAATVAEYSDDAGCGGPAAGGAAGAAAASSLARLAAAARFSRRFFARPSPSSAASASGAGAGLGLDPGGPAAGRCASCTSRARLRSSGDLGDFLAFLERAMAEGGVWQAP